MIKQNPMNEIVKVQHSNGSVEIVEMAPSQIAELTTELCEGLDRKGRKEFRKMFFHQGEVFTLSNGDSIKVINHTKMANHEKPYYPA